MHSILSYPLIIGTLAALAFSLFAAPDSSRLPEVDRGVCWQKEFDDRSILDVTSDLSLIVVTRSGARVTAVDAEHGQSQWSTDLGGELVSNVLSTNNGIAVITRSAGRGADFASLRLLSRHTGIPLWFAELQLDHAWLFSAGEKIVVVDSSGRISSYSGANGKIEGTQRLAQEIVDVVPLNGERALLSTSSRKVVLVSLPDGSVVGTRDVEMKATSLIGFEDGAVLIGDSGGRISAVRFEEKRTQWVFRNGGGVSSFAKAPLGVVVTSFDNFVYLLMRDGDVRWKRRLTGRLATRAAIGSTVALVPAENEGTVFVLKLRNGKVTDQIRMYDEGTQNRLFVTSLGGDVFVIADADTIRSYSPGGCSADEKKQP